MVSSPQPEGLSGAAFPCRRGQGLRFRLRKPSPFPPAPGGESSPRAQEGWPKRDGEREGRTPKSAGSAGHRHTCGAACIHPCSLQCDPSPDPGPTYAAGPEAWQGAHPAGAVEGCRGPALRLAFFEPRSHGLELHWACGGCIRASSPLVPYPPTSPFLHRAASGWCYRLHTPA